MAKKQCITEAVMNRLYDGELPEPERSAATAHLEQCPDCRERWNAFKEGERLVQTMLSTPQAPTGPCCDDETLAAYADKALSPEEMRRVKDHLRECSACNQLVLSTRHMTAMLEEREALPDTELVAGRMLGILARLPDVAGKVRDWLHEEGERAATFLEEITLPCWEPRRLALGRLAAETGEGFARQDLRQPESPFDVQLAQFGREARVIVIARPKATAFRNCLVRVSFLEAGKEKGSRILLVKDGRGQCLLTPAEVERLRPEEKAMTLKAEPVVTLERLQEAGAETSVAILSDLAKHAEPLVRQLSIELLGETRSPHALPAVSEAKSDPHPDVQSAAQAAEAKLRQGHGRSGEGAS